MYTSFKIAHSYIAFQSKPVSYFATKKPHYTGTFFSDGTQLVGWKHYKGKMFRIRHMVMKALGLHNDFLTMRSYIEHYDIFFPYKMELKHGGGYEFTINTPKTWGVESKVLFYKKVDKCNVKKERLTNFDTNAIQRELMKYVIEVKDKMNTELF